MWAFQGLHSQEPLRPACEGTRWGPVGCAHGACTEPWGPRHLHPSQRLQGLLLLGSATAWAPALDPCSWATQPSFLCPQDLKPGNLAVNEDCELKVCVG